MKIFLHFGAHKTGTSLLQTYLSINQKTLKSKRVEVLLLRQTIQLLGSWCKNLCTNPDLLTAALSEKEKRGVKQVIISCEDLLGPPFKNGKSGFYPLSPTRFSALQKALAGHDVTAVIYIRPQAEFLESWYLQTINTGYSHSFEEWLKSVNLDTISWKSLIDSMKTSLSPQKVIVEDFSKIRNGAEEYIKRFATHVNIPNSLKFPKSMTRNVSLSAKGLQLALATYPILDRSEKMMMRRFLQSNFSNKVLPRPELLSPEQKAEISSRWESENRKLLIS